MGFHGRAGKLERAKIMQAVRRQTRPAEKSKAVLANTDPAPSFSSKSNMIGLY